MDDSILYIHNFKKNKPAYSVGKSSTRQLKFKWVNGGPLLDVYWELIYSQTSKIRTPVFRNTGIFEINLGHTGFRARGISMIYLIIVYNNMFWAPKRNVFL